MLRFIAEIHPQHGGSKSGVLALAEASISAGADIVKVQLYDETLLGEAWDYLILEKTLLHDLGQLCLESGAELSASIFSLERLDWCLELDLETLKVASRTVAENPELVTRILESGKETIISLGKWKSSRLPFSEYANARYLTCVSQYPAPWKSFNPSDFDFRFPTLGLSDHSIGSTTILMAASRGATVLEKHITFDRRKWRPTEQAHICSWTPAEMEVHLPEARRLSRMHSIITGFDTST